MIKATTEKMEPNRKKIILKKSKKKSPISFEVKLNNKSQKYNIFIILTKLN